MAEEPVRVPVNDLMRAYRRDQDVIEEAVLGTLRSGWYVHGPEHAAFEAEFADYVGVRDCVGVGNGTDALELALAGVGVDRGDRVVTAANAGMYTSVACLKLGAAPVFVDVER